jgi:hypothetical protein
MDDEDSRWMSFGELTEARKINQVSAHRLVRRRKWPRRTDNLTKAVHVLVPVHALQPSPEDEASGQPEDDRRASNQDITSIYRAFELAVKAFTERAAAAEVSAEAALAAEREVRAQLATVTADKARLEVKAKVLLRGLERLERRAFSRLTEATGRVDQAAVVMHKLGLILNRLSMPFGAAFCSCFVPHDPGMTPRPTRPGSARDAARGPDHDPNASGAAEAGLGEVHAHWG